MMFASFVVTLRPTVASPVGRSTGRSLHGLFFHMLEQQDADLAQRAHAENEIKPLTVSPLLGHFKRDGERTLAMPDETYWVRYTTLTDELFNGLSQVLMGKFLYRSRVTIDGAEFGVHEVAVEPESSHGWGRLASAEEIWEQADTLPDITLRFSSPTAFRQRGLNLLFPIPRNIFYSYRERWNVFAPFAIDDEFIDWVEANVAVEAYQLETRVMPYGDFQMQGFTGWVRYTTRDRSPDMLKRLNALADFAFFCGTGSKTTQGMGQTRRLGEREGKAEG